MTSGFLLVNRYIFKELVLNFILCVVLLLTIILVGKGLQLRELFLNLNLNILDVIVLISLMMPLFLTMILPISCMLSVFLTFLRMGTDRETTALKAGGIGILQMLWAPVIFSTICMFLALYVSIHATPWGMESFRNSILEYANTKARVVLQPGVFNQNLFGNTIFARKVDPVTGKLEQVLFEDSLGDGNKTVTFLAPTGDVFTDEAAGQLEFVLENGYMYQLDDNKISVLSFEEYRAVLNLDKLFAGAGLGEVRPKEMMWGTLLSLARQPESDKMVNKILVEIHKRLSLPVACLVLGVFAMPVACFFEGSKRHHGIILTLVMFLVYYGIFSIGVSAGETGSLPASIGMWLGNLVFVCFAAFALYLANKERIPSFSIIRLIAAFRKRVTGKA